MKRSPLGWPGGPREKALFARGRRPGRCRVPLCYASMPGRPGVVVTVAYSLGTAPTVPVTRYPAVLDNRARPSGEA